MSKLPLWAIKLIEKWLETNAMDLIKKLLEKLKSKPKPNIAVKQFRKRKK